MPHRGFPAVMAPSGIRNRLLATLPPSDFDLLAPGLETIAFDQDAVISRAGDQIEHVFFPDSGAISLMIDMADGGTVATALVGREGAVGILSVLGPSPSDGLFASALLMARASMPGWQTSNYLPAY